MLLRIISCKNDLSATLIVCLYGHIQPYTGLASTSPLDYMVDKYSRLAGIPKQSYRSFHSLRRAFGTELAEAEIPGNIYFTNAGTQGHGFGQGLP